MTILEDVTQVLLALAEQLALHPLVRHTVAVGAYVLLPLALVLAFVALPPFLGYALARSAGSAAQALLLVILFMKPLGLVFDVRILKRTLIYRRPMGVAMFYLALYHFAVLVIPSRILDPRYYVWSNHVIYGAIALAFAGLLWLTSNDRAVRLLRRNWKRLHTLAYPLLFLVLFHGALGGGEWSKLILLAPAYIVLKVLERRRVHISLPLISAR